MKSKFLNPKLSMVLILFTLTGCVAMPTGPSVMVLPGAGKNFDLFRSDDYECRQYAYEQVGGATTRDAAVSSGLNSAAIGAGLGAIAGVALGGGEGAAIGAGTGLLAGGLAGSGTARTSGYIAQERYDNAYIQCMYAKGHHVPVSGNIRNNPQPYTSGYPSSTPPPPPPGYPPPRY
ncbi:MAG: hypothetical protein H6937_10205 [Burkholderiales bacterium]|nr:hypothetical protein [Burkholderiales bacterium]MDR4516012.1 hypothetical protein [Nitrosomonas sp.]